MEAIPISIAAKISEYLVAPIGRQLSYLFQLSRNVETLKKELENLRNLKTDVQQEVEVAGNNVDKILKTVETWLDRVSSVEGEAQSIVVDNDRFPEGCFNNWCLNLKSRYVLSRRAKKRTRDIVRLRQEGNFKKVSLPAPPKLFIGSASTTFDSRERILNEIIKSLKDEDINIIGICGMGGVGKTTMVDEVLKRVKEENMFDDYAKTVVSQKEEPINLQRDIAEMLGLRLEENNLDVRAGRLNERLEGKKILIILDDVWKEFILKKDLGISLEGGQKKCKIVFTSRTRGLWMDFESRRRELMLHELPYSEALNLFKEKVGNILDEKPELVPIAEDIVKECGGLPLAVVALGCALRGHSKYTWNDTRERLRITLGVEPKVLESLRLSYDHLGKDEAKSVFLLCSLFQEDSRIYIESLVNMGMGLRLFKGIICVEAARNRVFALVEHLQSRCLVSKEEDYITVHDVVRDVSKSIASTENGSFVLEHGVTLDMSLDQTFPEHCTRISVISDEITKLPSQLQFPRLELLRSSNKNLDFSNNCFEGMVKLQVLDINWSISQTQSVLKLPSSLQYLTNLHTLCLHSCRLEDFTAIKFLRSLEILRITRCYNIEELPKEIEQLTKLRLLDMSNCESLKRISPGIISGLTVLEELYLGGLDIDWGAEENEEGRIAAHEEFKSLSNLYVLHIVIKDPSFLPLFKNLKRYKIQIGGLKYHFIYASQKYERTLSISGVALEKDFNFILHHSEALLLKGESTKSLVYELVRKASQSIKCLEISETDTPEYLANAMDCTKAPFLVSTLESLRLESLDNLHQIINAPLVAGNFAKLKKLVVFDCKQLRNIFRLSNAVDVLYLEELHVWACESMQEIICWEGREEEANRKMQFPNLKRLIIFVGKSLICLCKGANEIEFHQLEEMKLGSIHAVECFLSDSDENRFFPPKVLFPRLLKMSVKYMPNVKQIWCGQPQAGSFHNLARLHIIRCDSLEYAFNPCMAKYLVNLHKLAIKNCRSLKEVVATETDKDAVEEYSSSILPKLKYVKLDGLPALERFCHIAKDLEFRELDDVYVISCPEFKTFAPGFVHTPKLNLVKLDHKTSQALWKENLNNTVQHLFNNQQRRQKQEEEK